MRSTESSKSFRDLGTGNLNSVLSLITKNSNLKEKIKTFFQRENRRDSYLVEEEEFPRKWMKGRVLDIPQTCLVNTTMKKERKREEQEEEAGSQRTKSATDKF